MKTEDTKETEERIIIAFEKVFRCVDGQRCAWFELPQRDGERIRGTYVVYAAVGRNLEALEAWFIGKVVGALAEQAGNSGYLYWRRPERVEVYEAQDGEYVIRTRIAVFNEGLEEVSIDSAIPKVGLPAPAAAPTDDEGVDPHVAMRAPVQEGINALPAKEYPYSIRDFGAKNVEQALIFVARVSDPKTGMFICLSADDESISDVLNAAFSADKREELNSGSWVEKLSDAVATVRYSMKLPLILLPDGGMRVTSNSGNVVFEGTDWDFVRWVRDEETVMIDGGQNVDTG